MAVVLIILGVFVLYSVLGGHETIPNTVDPVTVPPVLQNNNYGGGGGTSPQVQSDDAGGAGSAPQLITVDSVSYRGPLEPYTQ